jgi:hypothetical protein
MARLLPAIRRSAVLPPARRFIPRRALSGLALPLVVLLLGVPRAAVAQTPLLGASAAGQTGEAAPTIRKITIKFTGVANVTEEIVRANMSLREGMPYD